MNLVIVPRFRNLVANGWIARHGSQWTSCGDVDRRYFFSSSSSSSSSFRPPFLPTLLLRLVPSVVNIYGWSIDWSPLAIRPCSLNLVAVPRRFSLPFSYLLFFLSLLVSADLNGSDGSFFPRRILRRKGRSVDATIESKRDAYLISTT